MAKLVAFDFESEGIELFPDYPPKPTMLSIYEAGKKPKYYSWGHPIGNNATEADARAVLTKYWNDTKVELLAQNIAFDTAIAHKHWGLPLFRKGLCHDTMVQAFLLDPHAKTYALKPNAERYLGLPPDEQDAVKTWLVNNKIVRANQKDWGAYISKAPGTIVGPYCIGDVERTMQLFDVFRPKIEVLGMTEAYTRELKLIPVMLESTLAGVVVDVKRLTVDVAIYEAAMVDIEKLLFKELKTKPFNIDSDEELANAIDKAIPGLSWVLTATGKRSTSKANMEITLEGVTGKLGAILQYRASVNTCLNTFMKPWLLQANAGDGRMRCQWNTTRSDTGGARTGRLSSTPSLMNIPTLTSAKFAHAIALHLKWLPKFPALPNVRSYLLADKGDVLVSFDFASQELRTLAHYEDGVLLQAYKDDPTQDLHQYAADLITSKTGKPFSRKAAKTCIAKDQLVLTQTGLVPIQNITGLHLIWDGVEWVKHTGVLNKGIRQVIEYAGLGATYDHEVWTDEYGKIQFGDAAERSATLTRTGKGRTPIRLLEDNQTRGLAQSRQAWRAHTYILGRRVSALWAASVEVIGQFNSRLLNAVPQLQHDKVKTLGGAWCQVRRYLATLQCVSLSKLQGAAYRSSRQQRSLPTRQLETNNKFGECLQQVLKPIYRLLWTAGKPYASLALVEDRPPTNGVRAWAHSQETSGGSIMAGASSYACPPKWWSEVYDITNAGPRNRFTVSGYLVSNCAFAILYGSGLGTLARQLESSVDEAGFIKRAYLSALPGVADLIKDLKLRAKNNEPIITWGGRVYYVEPPRMVDNRYRTFDYKLLNYLCQGSAADLTKAAIVAYHKRAVHGRIVLTVHDQIVITVPKKHWKTEAAILRSCMEGLELDAKLLADGSMGPNLHNLKDFE